MPKLVLVRHSISNHNSLQAPEDWDLTDEGVARCRTLAQHIKPYRPRRLFTSPMPKTRQTATSVSQALGDIPLYEEALLAEHSRRSNAPYGSQDAFDARMKRLFAEPDRLVFGEETARQAEERFRLAIETVLDLVDAHENIVVVTHGTVMSLFAARYNAIDSFELWQRLEMPSLLELDLPDFRLTKVIEDAGRI